MHPFVEKDKTGYPKASSSFCAAYLLYLNILFPFKNFLTLIN
uniref:Uncharacterized protein n=1 Tax=Rhizophora mucronata TaxID=61149 RepID=A0A2P2JGB4_RHIMU